MIEHSTEQSDRSLSEERLALLSVLQELTVAALDLFDPQHSADGFMDRLAERLDCVAALWMERGAAGRLQLAGAAGLSRASRQLPLGWIDRPLTSDPLELALPYSELNRPNLVRWSFPIPPTGAPRDPGPEDRSTSALLLYFLGEPQYPLHYRGMLQRLVGILGTVLLHRELFARTIESEQRLHRKKTLLESQSEASVEGILLVSTDRRILSRNRRFVEMWGVQEEIQTGSLKVLTRALCDRVADEDHFKARVARFAADPELTIREEFQLKDGRIFERYAAPIRSADGVLYGQGLYYRDITEQRRAEAERDRLLEQEQAARVRAEEAIGLRDEFLSVASHELKTPVTSLQLVVQRALRLYREGSLASVPPEVMLHTFETIQRQTRRLGALVNAMLDVSRIHAGKMELDLEQLDLSALVRNVVSRFEEEIARSGSEVTVRAESPVWCCLDRSRVDQVITNLLSNALKYGEGKPIDVSVSEADGVARLVVRDQGIGVPADRTEKIFQPFERAVSIRSYGGLGLGLHIVRKNLEMLKGTIRVESELGRGTTFTVELPLQPPGETR